MCSPSNRVSVLIESRCTNGCGYVVTTPTGSCFGYQKLSKGPTRPEFEWLILYFMLALSGQCWVYAARSLYERASTKKERKKRNEAISNSHLKLGGGGGGGGGLIQAPLNKQLPRSLVCEKAFSNEAMKLSSD